MLGIDVDVVHALSLRFIVDCQVTERTQKRARHPSFLFLWGKKQHSQIHFIMRNRPTPGWSSQSGNCRVSEGVPVPRLYNGLNCRNTCFRGVATYICTVLIFLVRCQTCIQCYALQVLSYSYPLSLLANMATSNLGLSHPRKKNTFLSTDFFCSQDLLRFSYALCAAFDGVATLLRGLSAPSA